MFRAFSDVQTAEMLDLPRPRLQGGKPIVVACPMSEEQHELQDELVERYERLRSQKIDPRVDNALNITTDGRKLATDAQDAFGHCTRLPAIQGQPAGGECHRHVAPDGADARHADDLRRHGSKSDSRGDIRPTPTSSKAGRPGIPREQIAAIGDAESDAKKQALFEKVRNGSVRVLIGSTQKMGTGTNVQKRLVALHHLDAPWKPAEVEQREGRILRQGTRMRKWRSIVTSRKVHLTPICGRRLKPRRGLFRR